MNEFLFELTEIEENELPDIKKGIRLMNKFTIERPHEAIRLIKFNRYYISNKIRISSTDFINLWRAQNGKCYLTNHRFRGDNLCDIGIDIIDGKYRLVNFLIAYSHRFSNEFKSFTSNNDDFADNFFKLFIEQLNEKIGYNSLSFAIQREAFQSYTFHCKIRILTYNFNFISGFYNNGNLTFLSNSVNIADPNFDPFNIFKNVDLKAIYLLRLTSIIDDYYRLSLKHSPFCKNNFADYFDYINKPISSMLSKRVEDNKYRFMFKPVNFKLIKAFHEQ